MLLCVGAYTVSSSNDFLMLMILTWEGFLWILRCISRCAVDVREWELVTAAKEPHSSVGLWD